MLEQKKQEFPREKERKPPKLGKKTKVVLAAMAAIGAVAGVIGLNNKFNKGDNSFEPRAVETQQARTELDFLDWYRMPREIQEATALFLEGRDVVLKINTPNLRLHTKLINPDHLLVDLNVEGEYPSNIAPAESPLHGKPMELRLTTDQHRALKDKFGYVDGTGEKEVSADIPVPAGTKLNVIPKQLPRGTSPSEIATQLVFQGFTSPSR